MKLEVKALPADVHGLGAIPRAALAAGPAFGPVPVALRPGDIPRPEERLGDEERAALRDSIAAGYRSADIELAAGAARSLDALGQVGTFCVITGQQPGLFASPLYSLVKAIQAVTLAGELEALWGTPVVPVFWNHGDDHDIAEVHHAWQLNRNLDLQKIALPGMSSGRTPVSRIALSNEAQALPALRAQVRGVIEEFAGADDALDLFMPRDGETLVRALTRIFHDLLGGRGLLVCEPDWIRTQLSSELGRIVSGMREHPHLTEELRRGEAELRALGLEAPIPVGDAADDPQGAAALVYRHTGDPEERAPVRAKGRSDLAFDDEPGSRTHAELGAMIVGSPSAWSASALTRPLAQDAVFPTCAYVGGYGELGYHAQLGPARDAAGLPRTPFAPRVSITLIDGETRHALTRVGDPSIEEVARARGEWTPAEDGADEPAVMGKLREVAAEAAERLLALKAELAELEPALGITLKKTAGHVEQSIGKVVSKAERVHQNRAGKGARQVRRVNNTICPRGVPQERLLGPLQFVARYGRGLVDALAEELPALSTEHLVLHVHVPEEDD